MVTELQTGFSDASVVRSWYAGLRPVVTLKGETRVTENGEITIEKDETEVTVTKIWNDNNNIAGKRPKSIELELYNGNNKVASQVVDNTYSQEDNNIWSHTFIVPKYDESSNLITYTVDEKEINAGELYFYQKYIDQNTKTITNIFAVPTDEVDLEVTKIWIDNSNAAAKRPDSIILEVYDGTNKVGSQKVDSSNSTINANTWSYTFKLPKYDLKGNLRTYTVDEAEVNLNDLQFYRKSINNITKTVTNTFAVPEDIVNIEVTKLWNDNNNEAGKRPDSVILEIYDGKNLVASQKVDSSNATTNSNIWQYTFNLPKYDLNGNLRKYTINEAAVNTNDLYFYQTSIDDKTKTITNTFTVPTDTVDIEITKVWNDNSNALGKRPDSINVQVYENGMRIASEKLNKTNAITDKITGTKNEDIWKSTISLPKFDLDGNQIAYTLDESEVNDNDLYFYEKLIDNSTHTITNVFRVPQEMLSISIRKLEKGTNLGIEGAEIGITQDGEKEITAVTDSNGYATFTGLEVGKTYTYREVTAPSGYILNTEKYNFKIEPDGRIIDINGNRIIENEKIVGNITIYKIDKNSKKFLKNATITLYNYEDYLNGEDETEILKTDEEGKVIFENLEIGRYAIKEIEAPEGYKLNSVPILFEINNKGETVILEGNTTIENELKKEEQKDDTIIEGEIPQAGTKIIMPIINISVLIAVCFFLYKKMKY